jgi:hypothetical protein
VIFFHVVFPLLAEDRLYASKASIVAAPSVDGVVIVSC